MAKGHVGRPTNEEVAARKRKQILKVLLPCILIAVIAVIIVGQNGLKGLMGNTTTNYCNLQCEDGWTPDNDTNTCYQETTQNIKAYLLGDANNDGRVGSEDYQIMASDISNGAELDQRKQIIYDIDQNGEVDFNLETGGKNNEDLQAFNELLRSGSSSGGSTTKIYVCPENSDEGNTTIDYELNGSTCVMTTKVTKEGVCASEDGDDSRDPSTSGNYQNTVNQGEINNTSGLDNDSDSNVTDTNTPVNPSGAASNKGWCIRNTHTNQVTCSNTSDKYSPIISSSDDADEDVEEEDIDDIDYDDEDKYSVLNKESNYLNYLVSDQKLGTITLVTVNKNSKTFEANASINSGNLEYGFYANSTCSGEPYEVLSNNPIKNIWTVTSLNDKVESVITQSFAEYPVPVGGTITADTVLSVKQTKTPEGYETNSACQNFKASDNKTITFQNTPSSTNYYNYIKVDNGIINKGTSTANSGTTKDKIKFYSTENLIINNKASKKGYTFDGWSVKKSDGKYLCYSTSTKKISAGTKWATKCSAKVIVKNGNNLNDIIKMTKKNGETLTLKSEWIHKSAIKVTLKNSEDKKFTYNRSAKVYLYNDKATCEKDIKQNKRTKASSKNGKLGWVVKKVQYAKNSKTNKGILNISKDFRTKKTYYLSVDPSPNYKNYNKCVAVDYSTTKETLKLEPKTFTVKFDKNGGSGSMSSVKKTVDVDKKIEKPTFTKAGYKFDYWTVSRKYTDSKTKKTVAQYRCYKTNPNKKDPEKAWMTSSECKKYGKVKYDKDGNGFTLKINAQVTNNPQITLTAHYEKKAEKTKTSNTNNSGSQPYINNNNATTSTPAKSQTSKSTSKKSNSKKSTSKKSTLPKTTAIKYECPKGYSAAGGGPTAYCVKTVKASIPYKCSKGKLTKQGGSYTCKVTKNVKKSIGKCKETAINAYKCSGNGELAYYNNGAGSRTKAGAKKYCNDTLCVAKVAQTSYQSQYLKYKTNTVTKSQTLTCLDTKHYKVDKKKGLCVLK